MSYMQAIAAFCIFCIFAYLFKNRVTGRLVSWVSEISFEIYLYHYMFTVGPLKLFGLTGYWSLDCILVTAVVVIISIIMNRCSAVINKNLNILS